jgi:hypothetical protein
VGCSLVVRLSLLLGRLVGWGSQTGLFSLGLWNERGPDQLRVLRVMCLTLGLWMIGGSEGSSGHGDLGPFGGSVETSDE